MKSTSGALIVFQKKILLLLRDNKPGIPNPNKWSLIGGEVEEGETYDQALKREVLEEANISVTNMQHLGMVKTDDGNVHAIYIVRLNSDDVDGIKLGDEGQELKFFSIKELKNIPFASILQRYLKLYGNYLEDAIENDKEIDPKMLGFGD